MEQAVGIEPTTLSLEDSRSTKLSYACTFLRSSHHLVVGAATPQIFNEYQHWRAKQRDGCMVVEDQNKKARFLVETGPLGFRDKGVRFRRCLPVCGNPHIQPTNYLWRRRKNCRKFVTVKTAASQKMTS